MDFLKEIWMVFYGALFRRMPCKICLVAPICKNECQDFRDYRHIFGAEPMHTRAAALFLLIYITFVLPWIIYKSFT